MSKEINKEMTDEELEKVAGAGILLETLLDAILSNKEREKIMIRAA